MAKEKNEEINAVALMQKVEKGEAVSPSELGNMLKVMKSLPENEITADYLKLEPGEETKIFFTGMTTMKSIAKDAQPGDTTPAIAFVNEDGSLGINANAVIVSTCARLNGKPTPLHIICTGKLGKAPNQYNTYKIIVLS